MAVAGLSPEGRRQVKMGWNDFSAERGEGVGLLNVPTVVSNVMLRWENIVLW